MADTHPALIDAAKAAQEEHGQYIVRRKHLLNDGCWLVERKLSANGTRRQRCMEASAEKCLDYIWQQVARAVLKAVLTREPSEGMRGAGSFTIDPDNGEGGFWIGPWDADECYRAMTAALLKELER